MVGSLLTFCTLMSLLETREIVAQVENSLVSAPASSAEVIQLVAAETIPANETTDPVLQLLDRAIETTGKRTLTANSHSPWQIFHSILAMRENTEVRLGNQKVNAIQWLSTAEPQFDNQPWLLLTPHGAKFHPYTRIYAFEGHPAQFLALLSQSNLPMDHQFHVQGKVVSLNDLVNNTMKEVNTKEEVTWVLWALQHFLSSDATWTNQLNETWSIERLVQMESNAPVVGAPCGGNHRLFALTRTRDKYLASGGRLRGAWFQADQKIKQHIELARSLQNGDGSFSSDSYKGPGHTPDVNKRFNTTGHTMEFLSISLPKERLNEPWVRSAIWMLSRELIIHRDTKIDCGPLFHSLNALILYRERIRANQAPTEIAVPTESLARKTPATSSEVSSPSNPLVISTPKRPQTVLEPKQVAQRTEDLKPSSTPELKAVPMPIAEPIVIPETKAEPTQPAAPELPIPQARISSPNPLRSVSIRPPLGHLEKTKNPLPRIDPAKLSNVGQPASTQKLAEPPQLARQDSRTTAPPALLPELSAKPLVIAIPMNLVEKLQPGSLPPREPVFEKPLADLNSATTDPDPTSVPIEFPGIDFEAPASALEPANP